MKRGCLSPKRLCKKWKLGWHVIRLYPSGISWSNPHARY